VVPTLSSPHGLLDSCTGCPRSIETTLIVLDKSGIIRPIKAAGSGKLNAKNPSAQKNKFNGNTLSCELPFRGQKRKYKRFA
jgi:hypothetical protein